MIYYYIPDFFWNYNTNLRLLQLMREEPHMFYDDFTIGAVYGNFPNCIWNGGRSFFGRHVNVDEQLLIAHTFREYDVPLRLTMTNPSLEMRDLYDRYANYIMENLEDGTNQVLVSNPILEDYIRSTYPSYPIVRSILAAKDDYYDDTDRYSMSVLSWVKSNDIDFLRSIPNKGKIEILVNEICSTSCNRRYNHYDSFARDQLYMNKTREGCQCSFTSKYLRKTFYEHPLCITRDDIKSVYEPIGFQHFKLEGRMSSKRVIFDYAHYMVKPEWKEDFLLLMLDAVIADNK